MVEHAHEQHEVEPLLQRAHIVHGQRPKLDLKPLDLRGEAGLAQITSSKSIPSTRAAPRRFICME